MIFGICLDQSRQADDPRGRIRSAKTPLQQIGELLFLRERRSCELPFDMRLSREVVRSNDGDPAVAKEGFRPAAILPRFENLAAVSEAPELVDSVVRVDVVG